MSGYPVTTRILSIDPDHPNPAVIAEATAALRSGALVILPTETVYGVAADPRIPEAMDCLYAAKGRVKTKPLSLFSAGIENVQAAVSAWSDVTDRIARAFWPGPLTLVLRTAGGFTGFRVPDHAVPLLLLKEVGFSLAVTSANCSGEPETLTAEDAGRVLGDAVSIVLDAGPSPGGTPSTVVKIDGDKVEVLRERAISRENIIKTAKLTI